MDEEIIEQNRTLIEEFDWLYDDTQEEGPLTPPDWCFRTTNLDRLEPGYKIAFGRQLCEEIKEAQIKHGYNGEMHFICGSLSHTHSDYDSLAWISRLEGNCPAFFDEYANVILPKYVQKAKHTCSICGKPTDYKMKMGSQYCTHIYGHLEYNFERPMCKDCIGNILAIERITDIPAELITNKPKPPDKFPSNSELIRQFPFLAVEGVNRTNPTDDDETMLDYLEPGWKLAFGVPISEKILTSMTNKGRDIPNAKISVFSFGNLLRASQYRRDPAEFDLLKLLFSDFDVSSFAHYYEDMSKYTCCQCGRSAQFTASVNDYYINFFGISSMESGRERPFCARCLRNLLSIKVV